MNRSLFEIPNRANNDKAIVDKAKTVKKTSALKSNKLLEKIRLIVEAVNTNLGKFVNEYEVITDENRLSNYIKHAIRNGIISIDTETAGLDPIRDKIVGVCLYTPGEKASYVPIHHVSYVTGEILEGQLAASTVAERLRCLENSSIKVIMFNAKFDIRVLRNQLNVYLKCYWDCYLAARLMNENE